jgi:hypothetical protein
VRRKRIGGALLALAFLPALFVFVSIALAFGSALIVVAVGFGFFFLFFYLLPCATGVMRWSEPLEIMRWRGRLSIDLGGGDKFDKVKIDRKEV